MSTLPVYATRRRVQRALDIAATAREAWQIDDALQSASRSIDGQCHRVFYPWTGTRTYDWPNEQTAASWRLWLDDHELLSVTSLSSGGAAITSFLLRPDWGPPFTYLELDRSTVGGFTTGPSPQRSISITGLWGYDLNEAAAGALVGGLSSSATSVAVSDASRTGAGSLIRVGTERMVCTDAAMSTTGLTLVSGGTTASNADVVLTLSGPGIVTDEVLGIDGERMLAVDVVGSTVTVRRGWDGSVLATHSPVAPVNALRTLVVERGALGTTAASHNNADPVVRQVFPGPVVNYAVALALVDMGLEQRGMMTKATRGDQVQTRASVDIDALQDRVLTTYGRQNRIRAV